MLSRQPFKLAESTSEDLSSEMPRGSWCLSERTATTRVVCSESVVNSMRGSATLLAPMQFVRSDALIGFSRASQSVDSGKDAL